MMPARRTPVHEIIAEFAPRHVAKPRVLLPGRKPDRAALADLGVAPASNVAMPDVVIHDLDRDWLFLIDAATQRRHMTETRAAALGKHFAPSGRHLVLFSAFPDHRSFCRCVDCIAWETHVLIAEAAEHMIYFSSQPHLAACVRAA